ncbi:MAG: hypothetical protein ABIX10_14140 [Acidimicrobiales bacterium]
MQPSDARALWQGLEPYHSMIYFAPEGFEEYTVIGLEGMGQGYFAARSAAIGAATAEVVTATFFNFHPAPSSTAGAPASCGDRGETSTRPCSLS